jgi:NAD(P)-dependent dehydrogenase (short-subunit alcohol dehydrogenase family)
MDIANRTVLLLGGSGLVGMAVARELAPFAPKAILVSGLTRAEAEEAVDELRAEPAFQNINVWAEWGDIFVAEDMKEHPRADMLADSAARARLLDDVFGELTEDAVKRSALGALLLRWRPEIVVDCVNTATAFAYQNVFDSATKLREAAAQGTVTLDDVEQHLSILYLPHLIRHVQIALEAMRQAQTMFYLKVGTAGTGGMGLNIPFTHSEERPSRMLLAKSSVAGAHTLLLYLMARTPGAPAVKEIKPTAAISWKRIAHGVVRRKGQPILCYDATAALPLEKAFGPGVDAVARTAGKPLQGVYLDSGENGLFSIGEFETLTALGLMEYITPEEIAENVVREIRGLPTGKDVVAALDAATSGPTYRAGVLRESALSRMEELERQHGVTSVAFEMLGPPRLSKVLFESAILARLYKDLRGVAELDANKTAQRAQALIQDDDDLRTRILSIGLPILLPDGENLLRGPEVKVAPEPGKSPRDPRLVDNGWVDLRAGNWRKWRERAANMLHELETLPGAEHGSRNDTEPGARASEIRPGRMAAWIFRHEDRGERTKR